ncbi:hypothetical protein ABH15_00495 [Methanoculleus taiwanensis]|uniref:Proteinase inhibitor I42 chagasin domain-containing protein n=1 Tax=Methanoculleus taiwanensis TaxID=1550565 RepID=A0A498H3I7_9EURY|nr:protease inhibitor I42 family protein [Methanoculleus taiwanensis]RXE56698.1 hypothetical protein ABH15_00495 [Methanoculleus taiwanensis]
MVQMKTIYGIIAALILVACMAGAGCTGTEPAANETPAETPTAAETTAAPADEFVYNETNNGQTATVPVGSNITIQLDENPTTGYEWNVTSSEGLVSISDEFIPPSGQLVGAGGLRVWEYGAVENGTGEFAAVYKRPWEETTGNETTYTLTFTIV